MRFNRDLKPELIASKDVTKAKNYIVALAFDSADPLSPIRVYATTGSRGDTIPLMGDKDPIAVLMPCSLKNPL